ncbi:bifunctional alpha/beta hydrolase/OsmC family protein [Aestuariispira ectoiniformans]|uniref:bifunctional alpha/beta hydrolase/OsmC family protein n=1 Tax=Aestuariispira ectoiniformans TaxID=2775080 RepID=UPI00223AB800|nr:alpha/beta fold hydrolase [Aestuariispira ectoiniformans]
MRSQKVTFEGSQGNLAARLDLPEGKPRAYALFAHCFTCSKDIFAASRIAAGLTELGIATLRFDFTGLGASDGEFANTNFSSNVEDLLCAVRFLEENYQPPRILIGHSLGGAAMLSVAGQVDDAKAIATIGAPFDPKHVGHHFLDKMEVIERDGEAEVQIAGRRFRVKKQFLDDIRSHDLEEKIANLKKALLVFHAPMDTTVGVENASAIFLAAKHPKSFVSLDDADHLLSRYEDSVYVSQVIGAWAPRYVPELQRDQIRTDLRAGRDATVVAETGEGLFSQFIDSAGHVLHADEPFEMGGDNLGPTPYGFLLSGLGACTSMTVRMYARRKGIPLERVAVRLRHQKIHAEDCEEFDGGIDVIEREVELVGDMTEDEIKRLLEIADKCPVHRTLESKVRVQTKRAEE